MLRPNLYILNLPGEINPKVLLSNEGCHKNVNSKRKMAPAKKNSRYIEMASVTP